MLWHKNLTSNQHLDYNIKKNYNLTWILNHGEYLSDRIKTMADRKGRRAPRPKQNPSENVVKDYLLAPLEVEPSSCSFRSSFKYINTKHLPASIIYKERKRERER